MDLEGADQGFPFEGDYPHRPDDEECGPAERAIHQQVAELTQRRHEPALRRQMIALLQARRARQPRLVAIDFVPAETGFDTLLVRDELLVTSTTYERAQELLTAYGFVQVSQDSGHGCPELAGRIVQLTKPGAGAQELADISRLLRARGFGASVNHITPLAPVIKALGGAEPAAPFGRFPDRHPCHESPAARVAIIDTGITAEPRTDGWLESITRVPGVNIDPLDLLPNGPDGSLDFGAGHGTFAAGIVQRVAPSAEIRMYRAFDSDGVASEVDVACSMIRAVRDGAQILNLSFGCQTLDDQPPVAIAAALDVIAGIERERGTDVLLVAAAGNYGDTRPCWPAAFRRVVSVAGLTAGLQPAQWSSRGFWVTCSTVAEGLRSTYVEGRESVLLDPEPDTFGKDAWAFWLGTSFAAPQVAGAVARLVQERTLSPTQALVALLGRGRPTPDFGRAVRILPGI